MNATNLRNKLTADGIPSSIIDSIIASATKASAPKKPKAAKKNAFFSGAPSKSKKVATEVLVTCNCECCGTVTQKLMTIDILPGSPKTQKTATHLCNSCPSELRKLSIEELISVILLKNHPAVSIHNSTNTGHIRMSKKFTPEQVIVLAPNNY